MEHAGWVRFLKSLIDPFEGVGAMATGANVAVRFGELDKQALRELARRLQRNQSDTLRILVRETLAVLEERDAQQMKGAFHDETKAEGTQ
jgi:hypothetical protein